MRGYDFASFSGILVTGVLIGLMSGAEYSTSAEGVSAWANIIVAATAITAGGSWLRQNQYSYDIGRYELTRKLVSRMRTIESMLKTIIDLSANLEEKGSSEELIYTLRNHLKEEFDKLNNLRDELLAKTQRDDAINEVCDVASKVIGQLSNLLFITGESDYINKQLSSAFIHNLKNAYKILVEDAPVSGKALRFLEKRLQMPERTRN